MSKSTKKRRRRFRQKRLVASGKTTASSRRALSSMHGLMLLSVVTLALCGMVFGIWELRRNAMLQADIAELKEKRLTLIDHIKSANREIAALTKALHERQEPGGEAPQRKTFNARPNGPRPETAEAASDEGLPVSFDNGNAAGKTVALTFDGGSRDNAVDDILDTLKSRQVRATVFVTGDFLRAYPRSVQRIVSEGHETANHTFTHPHLTSWAQDHTQATLPQVTPELLCRELTRTDSVFFSITGKHCASLWRAPFGEKNRQICAWARACGYLHIGWRQGRSWKLGLDSNDWIPDEETPGFHTPEEVLEKITTLAQSSPEGIAGGIILMHLGTDRKDPRLQVHRILGRLIDELRQQGYTFVTVSEMLTASGVDVSLVEKNRRSSDAASLE